MFDTTRLLIPFALSSGLIQTLFAMKNEKLVRDKIQEFSVAKGDGSRFRIAHSTEMASFLAKKLQEEAQEAAVELIKFEDSGRLDFKDLVNELADQLEVMDEIRSKYNLTWYDLFRAKTIKATKKGAFKNGLILDLDSQHGEMERIK